MISMIFNENRVESDWGKHENIDTLHMKVINLTKIPKKFA